MSERFEKTYISVNEFIESWDKEIYELNLLDYFSYVLINEVGYQIEHNYLSDKSISSYLQLTPEEISTLAFNIGDSLENFLENNCLNNCALKCICNLNERVTKEEMDYASNSLHIIHIFNNKNLTRKQFLISDILNYVVLDTLYDFYNYEIGMELDDTDLGLLQFAEFITAKIEKFIENNGQKYLENYEDSSSDQFKILIDEANSDWLEYDADDFDETDAWKYSEYVVNELVEDYLNHLEEAAIKDHKSEQILTYFSDFALKYAGMSRIDEFNNEDIREFCCYWLVRELTLDDSMDVYEVITFFTYFFEWLKENKDISLYDNFSEFILKHGSDIENAIISARDYMHKHSVVEGLLNITADEKNVLNGLFEVININQNDLLRIRDVYRQKIYFNVRIDMNLKNSLLKGNIIEGSLKPTMWGWRIINLEYVYPAITKSFLSIE